MNAPCLRPLSAALLLSLLPAAALAADSGPYLSATFGVANQSDQRLDYRGNGAAQSEDSRLSSGGLAGAAVGYAFDSGWRVEGEFMYQSVDADDPGLLPPAPMGDGNYASTSVAINALYDFDWFGSPNATTYIGAGVVRLTEVDIDFESGGVERSFSGSDTGWQLLFGARYRLGEQFFVDAGLRYLAVSSLRLDGEDGAVGQIRADYEPWAATMSVGWRF